MAKNRTERDEDSLAIRAAWLHYAAGLTQSEVANLLSVSPVKTNRLINTANRIGAVKITVEGEIAECVQLESQIMDRFGLTFCRVAPNLYEDGLPLRALGQAGASFLRREIETPGKQTIGLGHGRTLAAAVDALPRLDGGSVQFVSLLGGLTGNYAANPHDVMHHLARKTGSKAFFMPVPFFANTSEDREILLSQAGVRDVLDRGVHADLMLIGIGTARPNAQLVSSDLITAEDIAEVRNSGGVAEVLGHFLDDKGAPIATSLTSRTVSPELAQLEGRRIIALAGGLEKRAAIHSALLSGLITGLITDELTACALMDAEMKKPSGAIRD